MRLFSGTGQPKRGPHSLSAIAVLGALLLGSCSNTVLNSARGPAGSEVFADTDATSLVAQEPPSEVPAARPQLIRRASLRMRVESTATSREEIAEIVARQGGDILGLQEDRATSGARRSATLQLRVPQARLDRTLNELTALGTLLSQQVTAEDVSNQLVDFEARLKNLRRAEQTLLGIMERSGKVAEVLEVARELANTRQAIEQIDASLTKLKNQVAFSSIDLYLVEVRASVPQRRSVSQQIQAVWQQATSALGSFSLGILRLLIWLFVFSPYWLSVSIFFFLIYRYRHRFKSKQLAIAPKEDVESP